MAASQDNVAVAYRSIGGFIRVKVSPTQFTKPDPPWLPDGTRVFDIPFDSISSLIFDERGKYLVASAENGYLVHWKLDGHVFDEVPWEMARLGEHQFAQSMTVSASGDIVATGLGSGKGRNRDDGCIRIGEIKDDGVSEIANSSTCADAGSIEDPMPIGWNIVAMDHDGKILVAANSSGRGGRGLLLRRHGNVFEKQAALFPTDVTTASVSIDGTRVVIANRSEQIYSMEEANANFKATYIGTIDSSCVRFSGAQHRVSAISFYGKDSANFLVATQEGCLAFFEKDVSGWKPSSDRHPDARRHHGVGFAGFALGGPGHHERPNPDLGPTRPAAPAGNCRCASPLVIDVCLAFAGQGRRGTVDDLGEFPVRSGGFVARQRQ